MALLDEIATWLTAGGIASTAGSTGWQLWKGAMPDSTAVGDRAVLVRQTGGLPPIWTLDIDQPSFQVVVRGARLTQVSSAYKEARAKAQSVRDRLHFQVGQAVADIAYPGILAVQEPTFAGDDLQQRPLFVCNYRAWRLAGTAQTGAFSAAFDSAFD